MCFMRQNTTAENEVSEEVGEIGILELPMTDCRQNPLLKQMTFI